MRKTPTKNGNSRGITSALITLILVSFLSSRVQSQDFIGVAGSSGAIARESVFKLICSAAGQGSGFLHKSGLIVTAAHVARGCTKLDVEGAEGSLGTATVVGIDERRDVALLRPDRPIRATSLAVRTNPTLTVGEPVAIWGYPGGYAGKTPLLATGVVAGRDICQGQIQRTVINAAINHGDSGGPIVDAQTGEIIGISDSKIVPLLPSTADAMVALGSNPSGMMYAATAPDGTRHDVSEAQVINSVLNDLASQVQLVVGCAVSTDDLKVVLENQGISP